MHDANPEYKAMTQITIREIGLSDYAVELLEPTGISTVADCLDHFFRGVDGIGILTPTVSKILDVMDGEVRDRLQELGYWSFYERNKPSYHDYK